MKIKRSPMKKSELMRKLTNYDTDKGMKRKIAGDAPVVKELRAFLNTRADDQTVIPYADFESYLAAKGKGALVEMRKLVGESLSKDLLRNWYRWSVPPLKVPADVWRSPIAKHLHLRAISHLMQTCRFFRDVYQPRVAPGNVSPQRSLITRAQDEDRLRARLEELIKCGDEGGVKDLVRASNPRTTGLSLFYSKEPEKKGLIDLVGRCVSENPKLNLFYKQGALLQTRGLPPLFIAASRCDKNLWEWLHARLLEQIPEEERSVVSAVASLQWSVTNYKLDQIQTLLTAHPTLMRAKSPLLTWNSTPLHIAASLQQKEVHDLLVRHVPAEYGPVCELMWLVKTGCQDSTLMDYVESKQCFEVMFTMGIDGLSPWQSACAPFDTDMMKSLLALLPAKYYQQALQQLEAVDMNDWHFSPAPLFKAYQEYINNGKDGWRIGDEFRRIPQHLQAALFQPIDFDPKVKKGPLQRRCAIDNTSIFPMQRGGLGFRPYVLVREERVKRYNTEQTYHCYRSIVKHCAQNLSFLKDYFAACQEEYREIKQHLQSKILEASPPEPFASPAGPSKRQ
jgi:hypothetical protein